MMIAETIENRLTGLSITIAKLGVEAKLLRRKLAKPRQQRSDWSQAYYRLIEVQDQLGDAIDQKKALELT